MLSARCLVSSIVAWCVPLAGACGSDEASRGSADSDADSAPADVAPDATGADAADSADSADADSAPPEPGTFGAACVGNEDCNSGYCVEGPSGYICTRACDTECPGGFDCKSIPGANDVSFVCVPRLEKLCTPCTDDLQCGGGSCLDLDGARACAPPCDDGACKPGFACDAARGACLPTTGSCTCSAVENAGERACRADTELGTCFGIERCDPEVGWGACSAASPGPEDCNGLDDDCNGESDDGLVIGAACENTVEGVGACAGVTRCDGSLGWACDGPTPAPEACNDADDDCDGASDEDFKDADGRWTLATACGRCGNDCTTRFVNGVGRCGGTPDALVCEVDHCDAGFVLHEGQCVPPIDTTCQSCSGDDDCLGGSCLDFAGEATQVCFMPCAASGPECPAGLACTAFGAILRCAPTSGSCACTPALAGNIRTCSIENANGRCLGTETCQEDAWSPCDAATPAPEVCNDGDDDCDGQIDEAARWENRDTPCSEGRGVCTASGVWQCDPADASGPTVCSAEPGQPAAESCNGLDDDCDDFTDEALTAPPCPLQLGVCAGAKALCAGMNGFLACNAGNYGPDYEALELSCDDLDNDCDGVTDEVDLDGDGHVALACGGDDCNDDAGLAHPGLAEVCGDELDNDCNGAADDKDADLDTFIAEACGGLDCDDGASDVNPDAIEVCANAIDDDCSGVLDDKDVDGDGQRDVACSGGTDCNDADADVKLNGNEVWDTKDNDCDGLYDEGLIPAGTVVITEVMQAPLATADNKGEYIELVNRGGSAVNLASWNVDVITVNASLVLPPGGFATLCRNGSSNVNGGVSCAYSYGGGFDLGDAADSLTLSLAGVEIDHVAWDASYPIVEGRSLSLDPLQTSLAGNDRHGNWCATPIVAGNLLTGGDYGTPGRANPACSGNPLVSAVDPDNGIMHGGDVLTLTGSGFIAATAVSLGGTACAAYEVVSDTTLSCTTPEHVPGVVGVTVTKGAASNTLAGGFTFTGTTMTVITWVDLQYPKTVTMAAGVASELIYGQVRAQGVTEPAGAPPGIRGQVGYGPLGTDPRTTPGWRWLEASWNKQFFDNDEYMVSLLIPTAGSYSYAYRFTDDDGVNFMYGDFDPGTADGIQLNNLGTATVQ